jgi:hypothetical protein
MKERERMGKKGEERKIEESKKGRKVKGNEKEMKKKAGRNRERENGRERKNEREQGWKQGRKDTKRSNEIFDKEITLLNVRTYGSTKKITMWLHGDCMTVMKLHYLTLKSEAVIRTHNIIISVSLDIKTDTFVYFLCVHCATAVRKRFREGS